MREPRSGSPRIPENIAADTARRRGFRVNFRFSGNRSCLPFRKRTPLSWSERRHSRIGRSLRPWAGSPSSKEWFDFLRKVRSRKGARKDVMSSWLVFRQSVDNSRNSVRNELGVKVEDESK